MSKKFNLKDKVEEINTRYSVKSKPAYTTDNLQNKVSNIKKKMITFAQKNSQEMIEIKTEATQLLHQLEQNNLLYQSQAQSQLREIQLFSQEFQTKIEQQILQRKEKENFILQNVDKKLKFLRNQIQKEKKIRQDSFEQMTNTLQKDVPSLMNAILTSSQEQDEEEEKLGEIIKGEISECQELTNDFKEKQDLNSNKIFQLIRDLTLRAKKQVEEEKAIRDQTHDEILSYVEETCNSLGQES